MDGALNITNHLNEKYPGVNMYPNTTLIVISKKYSSNSNQQMFLLAGMAFIGGILAGLLIRCLYFGIVKHFTSNSDDPVAVERPARGNVNPSFVDDNFRSADDQPPDYLTVVTDTSTNSNTQQEEDSKPEEGTGDLKVYDELPPNYKSVVTDFNFLERSSSV